MEIFADPDLVKFARLAYRAGFCKEIICNLVGFDKETFRRSTKGCKQGDKEELIDKLEI